MSSVRGQFEKEAEALVQLISDMIDAGQLAQAEELIEQYKLLNPTDPQLPKLVEKLGSMPEDTDAPDLPEHAKVLKDTETIYVVSGLGTKRTGVFTSIFGKVKLMEERLGYNSTILLCRHDIDLKKTEVWLKTFTGTSSILGPGTKILSIYEYFQKSYTEGLTNKAIFSRDGKDDGLRYEALSEKTYAVYDGDKRVRLDVYTGYSGSLRTERYYKPNEASSDDEIIEKEVYYDDWGYLNNIRTYDADNEDLFYVKYYTTSGKLCLEAEFDRKIDAFEPYKILVYDENEKVSAELGSNHELAALYFSRVLKEDKTYLMVFESGTVSEIAGFYKKTDNIKVLMITVVHSIFLKNAYDMKSEPQMYYEYLCKHPTLFDSIILLTNQARRDFNNLYGQHKSTFVIGHPYPYEIERADFDLRDHKKAVVVGRLFPEKQLEATVDIFSAVVQRIPDAKLELYGVGPEQEKIEKRIKKHKMENNIFLMGYTDDPISIYRTAALSIMTSLAEGYGLGLMESICNGCPAFAHNIKYGPSDIIKDGETGLLFPRNDKEKFARAIIKYFEDIELQRTMSENCYADTPRFSQDVFLEKWLGMVDEIVSIDN